MNASAARVVELELRAVGPVLDPGPVVLQQGLPHVLAALVGRQQHRRDLDGAGGAALGVLAELVAAVVADELLADCHHSTMPRIIATDARSQ